MAAVASGWGGRESSSRLSTALLFAQAGHAVPAVRAEGGGGRVQQRAGAVRGIVGEQRDVEGLARGAAQDVALDRVDRAGLGEADVRGGAEWGRSSDWFSRD